MRRRSRLNHVRRLAILVTLAVAGCSSVSPSGEAVDTTPPSNLSTTSMPVATTAAAPVDATTSIGGTIVTGDLEISCHPIRTGICRRT